MSNIVVYNYDLLLYPTCLLILTTSDFFVLLTSKNPVNFEGESNFESQANKNDG